LTAEHEQAAKAVADANAERDRVAGETAAAQQSNEAEGPARVAADGAGPPAPESPAPATPQPSPVVTASPTPEATPEAAAGANVRSTDEAEGPAQVAADGAVQPSPAPSAPATPPPSPVVTASPAPEAAPKAAAPPKVQSAQAPPAQPDAAPAKAAPVSVHKLDGMVLYNKPVFHNGHQFLWHGAWRGNPRAKDADRSRLSTRPEPATPSIPVSP
jgi:hypothetical protein